MAREILTGARIFDGRRLIDGHALVIDNGEILAILPRDKVPDRNRREVPGIIAPAFIDLQVNGGGGIMVDGTTDLAALRHICATHRALGTGGILPTLITDRPEVTAKVIATGITCARRGVPGFLGLHLEGPHLDPRRKGAHDPALIRPMTEADLFQLLDARQQLPALMVTLAPSAATADQIARLAAGGVTVSLGHSDCTHAEAMAAIAAGATCATHLFNAMSPLAHRDPGLPGAVLLSDLPAGLIADGLHVAPEMLRLLMRMGPRNLFLVSDCMAFAGSELTQMRLGGRLIHRQAGRLTLGDGTLAGADLTLPQAIATMAALGVPLAQVLAMATSIPARVIGLGAGRLVPGLPADLVHLGPDLSLRAVWQGGQLVRSRETEVCP